MGWTKGWVALFALITAIISLDPPAGIVELTAFSGSLYGACFFPTLILGLHWRRGNGSAVIASFLFGVTATDPLTLVGSAALLAVVAIGAALIPAWRAASVDPMVALRED